MYHLPRTETFAMTPESSLLLRSPALRQIERDHAHLPLMERAGAAAAILAKALQQHLDGPPLIFAGPGNNGGDALVLARLLKQAGLRPTLVMIADPATLPADARQAHAAWVAVGGVSHSTVPAQRYGLVADGLFGSGLSRAIEGPYAEWIGAINQYPGPILALDCPSGLNADTGVIYGPTVRASHTITFIAGKPGLYTVEGPDHCGAITTADLGLADAVTAAEHGLLLERATGYLHFLSALPRRSLNSHKGSHGSVGIIGGAAGMAGAALLAGRAALKSGAGRVYVGMLDRLALDPQQPELMFRPAADVFDLATVLAVGPGLGTSPEAEALLRRAIDSDKPLLIDADGLNLLAAHPALHRHVARRSAPTLLTPHPLEAARLLDQSLLSVQSDRIAATQTLARQFQVHVVLKGAGSIMASPTNAPATHWSVNASGNPGLATAGTGDVLSGIAAALLAQGCEASTALTAAVHLHGLAADDCVAAGTGPVGLTASELLEPARKILNRWLQERD
jgi:hydroxyethylthiazole kinase-like uncharacterized protein yjeF